MSGHLSAKWSGIYLCLCTNITVRKRKDGVTGTFKELNCYIGDTNNIEYNFKSVINAPTTNTKVCQHKI